MKKAVIAGPQEGDVIETTTPSPKEDWVKIKIHAAPLCTEYKGFQAGRESQFVGHEAAGEVVEIAQPGQVQVGDRVVVMPQYPCGTCALCLSVSISIVNRPLTSMCLPDQTKEKRPSPNICSNRIGCWCRFRTASRMNTHPWLAVAWVQRLAHLSGWPYRPERRS